MFERDWIQYRPSIPHKMTAAVRVVHERHLGAREEILVIYDETVFGSGTDGIVLTERGVCWRPFWGTADAMTWLEMSPDDVSSDGDSLMLADKRQIDLRTRPGMARMVAGVLRDLARMARQRGRDARGE
jgi:hypothetical protein